MEYLKIILRIIFFYFYIILIYRLMGKREVGQLGIIDLIVSILIADLVSAPIIDSTKSIVPSVMSVLSLVLLQIALSYTSLKSNTIRNLLDGNPTIIIKNGKINYQEMIKQNLQIMDQTALELIKDKDIQVRVFRMDADNFVKAAKGENVGSVCKKGE